MKNNKNPQINTSDKGTGLKNKERNKPDIINGPIIPTTIRLVLPVIASQLLSMVYFFVDTFYISLIDRSSTALLSSSGLVFPVYMIFYAISVGMWTGISSLVARGIGAKNEDVIDRAADSGLLLAIIMGILTLVFGLFMGSRIINLIAGSQLTGETLMYAKDYFHFLLPGMSVLLFVYMLAGVMSGEGLTKYIGIGMILSNLANIILAPIFIFLFKMGVKGAGLATSISIGAVLVYYASVFLRNKSIIVIRWNIFKARLNYVKEIARIGGPACLMLLSANVAFMMFQNLISSISQTAMNIWVLVARMDQIILLPAMAMGGVTTAMIGQNYGRGIHRRVEKIFYVHILLTGTACAVLVIFYLMFASSIFRIFSTIPEVIAGSVRQVRLLAFTIPVGAGILVIQSSFQATGRALPGLYITIIRLLIISLPLSMLLVHIYKLDITGVYIGIITGTLLSFAIAFLWGRSHIKGLSSKGKITPVTDQGK